MYCLFVSAYHMQHKALSCCVHVLHTSDTHLCVNPDAVVVVFQLSPRELYHKLLRQARCNAALDASVDHLQCSTSTDTYGTYDGC